MVRTRCCGNSCPLQCLEGSAGSTPFTGSGSHSSHFKAQPVEAAEVQAMGLWAAPRHSDSVVSMVGAARESHHPGAWPERFRAVG